MGGIRKGMMMLRGPAVGLAALAMTLLSSPGSARTWVPDPASEAYRSALAADASLEIHKDSKIKGDVHGNATVTLAGGVLVDGDLSAVVSVALRGATVTGSVSSPVPARSFPVFPTEEQARSLADRVLEGDHVFPSGTVVDDVVFVSGEARFRGSIDGRGTVIAGKGIRFDNVSRGQQPTLEPESLMSFVSLGDIWVGQGHELRGWLVAAGSIEAHMGLELEGAIIGGGHLALHKDALINYRAPDLEPPVIFDLLPFAGAVVLEAHPEIGASYRDEGSGVSIGSGLSALRNVVGGGHQKDGESAG